LTYLFMILHYPRPEYRDELLAGMSRVADVMRTVPGCLEVAPWQQLDSECVAAVSRWDSPEATKLGWAAVEAAGLDPSFNPRGEFRERERFSFVEIAAPVR
jgi:heme-degrading monooxygenase HmoA